MQDAVTRLLLDERENLRELVRAGDAEQLEQRHLRRAQLAPSRDIRCSAMALFSAVREEIASAISVTS